MKRLLIVYGTAEGQSARIAARLARCLREYDCAVTLADVADPYVPDPCFYDGIIVGGSVHFGRHPRPLVTFVRRHRATLEARPHAFYSVSMAAAGEDDLGYAEAARQVEAFSAQTGWHPARIWCFAGALRYTAYSPIKKWIMKRIARRGGPGRRGFDVSDTSHDYEFTRWSAVNDSAHRFARMLQGEPPREVHPVRHRLPRNGFATPAS